MGEKAVDMTEGRILPQMVRFGLPVLLGMLFQRIYNFVDVYIVGRYLGDNALAAVSIAGTAMYLLASVMMGLTTGVSVVIPRYYGAKECSGCLRDVYLRGNCVGNIDHCAGNDMHQAAASASADIRGAAAGCVGISALDLCRLRRNDAVQLDLIGTAFTWQFGSSADLPDCIQCS